MFLFDDALATDVKNLNGITDATTATIAPLPIFSKKLFLFILLNAIKVNLLIIYDMPNNIPDQV